MFPSPFEQESLMLTLFTAFIVLPPRAKTPVQYNKTRRWARFRQPSRLEWAILSTRSATCDLSKTFGSMFNMFGHGAPRHATQICFVHRDSFSRWPVTNSLSNSCSNTSSAEHKFVSETENEIKKPMSLLFYRLNPTHSPSPNIAV
jgi:hypothetical protein